MHLFRGLVSVVLIAGCSLEPTAAPANLVGSIASGKGDGGDEWELLYDPPSGEYVVRGLNCTDPNDCYIFDEKVLTELEPGIYQYSSTFPAEGATLFAFVDGADAAPEFVTLDVAPLDGNAELTLTQLATLYADTIGSVGPDEEGKADGAGKDCSAHWGRFWAALGTAGGFCSWSYAGGPWITGIVCGGSAMYTVAEAFLGDCSSASSTNGQTPTPTPTPSPNPNAPTIHQASPLPPAYRAPTVPRRNVVEPPAMRQGNPVPPGPYRYACRDERGCPAPRR